MFVKDFRSLFDPSLHIIAASNLLKHEECICISSLHQTSKNDVSE
ncbi:hypothetical protein N8838_00230 [Flavobacteriales bacterium]|nr:hypothetical protein [Flavobacteriales bacterium]